MTILKMRATESGFCQPITIKDECGCNSCITFAVAADTTIVFKPNCDFCMTTLTVTCMDFSIASPIITWVPTSAQMTTLGVGRHVGFVHLKNCVTPREDVARFCLTIKDD